MEDASPMASLRDYCRERGLTLGRRLGFGVHGTVFMAENHGRNDMRPITSKLAKFRKHFEALRTVKSIT